MYDTNVIGGHKGKTNGYSRSFVNQEKATRRIEHEERVRSWQSLTPKQQLAQLDKRLGKDIGASKQRKKIQEAMNGKVK